MFLDDNQCTCSTHNNIDKSILSLYEWTGQLNVDVIKSCSSVKNVNLRKKTNSSHCLIPPNLCFPKDRFLIDDGYHDNGIKNRISYLGRSSANNGCSIFCNGGKTILSNFNQQYYRLF